MPTTIDRERVRQLINQGAQLVEVLPAVEYVDEHLPGAISIPLNELERPPGAEMNSITCARWSRPLAK